jgi:hypothetical protein
MAVAAAGAPEQQGEEPSGSKLDALDVCGHADRCGAVGSWSQVVVGLGETVGGDREERRLVELASGLLVGRNAATYPSRLRKSGGCDPWSMTR